MAIALEQRPADLADEPWARWLPQGSGITVVRPGEQAPPWCVTVVEATDSSALAHCRDGDYELPPVVVAPEAADAAARRAAGSAAAALPERVRWADCTEWASRRASDGDDLRLALGAGLRGTEWFDLSQPKAHLLAAGAAASGKTTFLETLVGGAAHLLSPEHLAMTVIDCGDGTLAEACAGLPHLSREPATASDAGAAAEAIAAELDDRERVLTGSADPVPARESAHAGSPPRHLVVVDEFHLLAARSSETGRILTELLRRGDPLGVHVVLATSRPSGAVTAAFRDLAGVTVALRVSSGSESQDLIGSDDAADIPADLPGRSVLHRAGQRAPVQLALPSVEPTRPVRRADSEDLPGASLVQAAIARWAT